jgi:hypothetical protein
MPHRPCRNCGNPARAGMKFPLCGTCFQNPELRKRVSPKVKRAEARRAQLVQVATLEPLAPLFDGPVEEPEPELAVVPTKQRQGKLSFEQRDEIVQLVQTTPELPIGEVAETYGVSRAAIAHLLEKRGIEHRGRALRQMGRPPGTGTGTRLDPKLVAALVEAYANIDIPLAALEQAFDRDRSTIRVIATENGARPRPKGNFKRTAGRFERDADGVPRWIPDQAVVPALETPDNNETPHITEAPPKLTVLEAPRTQEERGIYVKLDTTAVRQLRELADAHRLDLEHEAHSLIEQALRRAPGAPPKPPRLPRPPVQSIKLALPPDLFNLVRRTAQDAGQETRDLISRLIYDMLPDAPPAPEEQFKMTLPARSPQPAPVARNGHANGAAAQESAEGPLWVMTYSVRRAITHPARTPEEAMAKLRELVGQDVDLLSIVRG